MIKFHPHSLNTILSYSLATALYVAALSAVILLQPTTAEAKTVSASDTYSGDLYYRATASDWWFTYVLGLENPHAQVHYHADVLNVDTGTVLADGAEVAVGTVLEFAPDLGDISWVGTGKTLDTPTGSWVPNAGLGEPTSTFSSNGGIYQRGQCRSQNFVNRARNRLSGDNYNVYIPFSVNPPAESVNVTGTAGLTALGGNRYRVDSPGTITAEVNFGDTYGRYYYQYIWLDSNSRGCLMSWDAVPMLDANLISGYPLRSGYSGTREIRNDPTPHIYDAQFAAQTINFSLSAVGPPPPSNNPPSDPSVNGAAEVAVGTPYSFDFVSTDPDGDNLYYEIDWDLNGTADQRVPSSGLVSEGVSQSWSRTWPTAGNRSFAVRAVDEPGAASGWRNWAVEVNAPSATLDFEVSINGGTSVASDQTIDYNDTIALSWSSTNVSSCTGTNFNTGGAANNTGLSVPNPGVNTTVTYTLDCTATDGTSLNRVINVTVSDVPPPTVTLQSRVDGGSWASIDRTIDSGQVVQIQWTSSNAVSCTGINVSTVSGLSGIATISNPAPGTNQNYGVTCFNALGVPEGADMNVTVNPLSPDPDPSPVATADISGSGCVILTGRSSCETVITYDSSNVSSRTQLRRDGTIQSASAQGTVSQALTGIGSHTYTFHHRPPSMPWIELDRHTVNSTCESGSTWDGIRCAGPTTVDPTPTPTANFNISTCEIGYNQSTCNEDVRWVSSDIEGVRSVRHNGTEFSISQNGVEYTEFEYGLNTFEFYHKGGSELVTTKNTVVGCANGLVWDGSVCASNARDLVMCFGNSEPSTLRIQENDTRQGRPKLFEFFTPSCSNNVSPGQYDDVRTHPLTNYYSADPTIATINASGEVRGEGLGDTEVFVEHDGLVDNQRVIVEPNTPQPKLLICPDSSLTLASPADFTIDVGESKTLEVRYFADFNATPRCYIPAIYFSVIPGTDVAWSHDPTIANSDGEVTGLAADNNAYIYATYNGLNAFRAFQVLAAPAAVSVDLTARLNNSGTPTDGPLTIDLGDTVTLDWTSTNADTCTGTNFSTGNATSDTNVAITEPAPGSPTRRYTLSCTGTAGTEIDFVDITTNAEPNLGLPNISNFAPSGTFDAATLEYDSVEVSFSVQNDPGTSPTGPFSNRFQFDEGDTGSFDSDQTRTVSNLNAGETSTNETVTLTNVPIGDHRIRVTADENNDVPESDENDNVRTVTRTLFPPQPSLSDPNIGIWAEREIVRDGESTTIRWNTGVTYPLSCTVVGPNVNVGPFDPSDPNQGPTGSVSSGLIRATQLYGLTCTEPITGAVFRESTRVEMIGTPIEI